MIDDVTREERITKGIDPFGRQWGVFHVPQSALYEIAVAKSLEAGKTTPDRRYPIPKECTGAYTSPEYARNAVKAAMTRMWLDNDVEVEKQKRKKHALKALEAEAKEAEKLITDEQKEELADIKAQLKAAQEALAKATKPKPKPKPKKVTKRKPTVAANPS